MRGAMTSCAAAQPPISTSAPPVRQTRAGIAQVRVATANPIAIPDQNSTGSTRPTNAPASVRDGSTANAAGATTADTTIAAPSHAASSTIATRGDTADVLTA